MPSAVNWKRTLYDSDGLRVSVDLKEIMRLTKWAVDFQEAARDPNILGINVKLVGSAMANTFNAEGGAYGRRWQGLSQFTQKTRTDRGYPAAHPILQQSGGLKKITADAFSEWPSWRSSGTFTDGKGTNMTGTITQKRWGGRVVLSVQGPKVDNHFGRKHNKSGYTGGVSGKGKTAGYLPARPFFGFPSSAVDGMAELSLAALMMKWKSLGGNSVKTQGSFIAGSGARPRPGPNSRGVKRVL